MWDSLKEGVTRPAAQAAQSIIRAATAAELQDRPGALIGDMDLLPYVTPEITDAVRALTLRALR
jgi:hypothetical protein